jgi:hypothetical protein
MIIDGCDMMKDEDADADADADFIACEPPL